MRTGRRGPTVIRPGETLEGAAQNDRVAAVGHHPVGVGQADGLVARIADQHLGLGVGQVHRLEADLQVVVDRVEDRAVQLTIVIKPGRDVLVGGRGRLQEAFTPVVGETRGDLAQVVQGRDVVAGLRKTFERQVVARAAHEARHLAGVVGVGGGVTGALAVDIGEVGLRAEALERARQEAEILLISDFEAFDRAVAGVVRLGHQNVAGHAVVGELHRVHAVGHEVVDVLVEHRRRQAAGRGEVPLIGQVILGRAGRLQLGVTARRGILKDAVALRAVRNGGRADRAVQIAVGRANREERLQLTKVRTDDRLGRREAQEHLRRDLQAGVQAGQDADIVAAAGQVPPGAVAKGQLSCGHGGRIVPGEQLQALALALGLDDAQADIAVDLARFAPQRHLVAEAQQGVGRQGLFLLAVDAAAAAAGGQAVVVAVEGPPPAAIGGGQLGHQSAAGGVVLDQGRGRQDERGRQVGRATEVVRERIEFVVALIGRQVVDRRRRPAGRDGAPVIGRLAGGGLAIGVAHAEAERAQPAAFVEGVGAVEALGPLAGVVAVMVIHGRAQIVAGGVRRVGLVVVHGDRRQVAGQVQRGRSRVGTQRVEHREIDGLGLGVDVLNVRRERPLVVRIVVDLQRVVRGHRAAVGEAGVEGRRTQAVAARRLGQRALQEMARRVIGERRAGGRTVGRAGVEAHGPLGRGLRGRRSQERQSRVPLIVRAPLHGGGDALALAFEIKAAIAEAAGHINRPAGHEVGAGEVRIDRDRVRAAGQLRLRQADQEAQLADIGVPAVAVERRTGRLPLLGHVADAHVGGEGHDALGAVERQTRAQVDRAADAAFDQIGRRVLVDVHAGHQFGRDIFEAQGAAALGREAVATVQFAANPRQAANLDARTFDRDPVDVTAIRGAGDGHAGDALQRFSDGAVRQGADVGRGDRIDQLLGVLLDLLGRLDGRALAGDDHFFDGLVVLRRLLREHDARRGEAQHQRRSAGQHEFPMRRIKALHGRSLPPVQEPSRSVLRRPVTRGPSPLLKAEPIIV
ncbi:hypothetical protein CC_0786 [Caulobacter vibrioides CB15]|uniref:Uncharacterized protein n=1 Tax=Caulobacter vibrioides (strain ATCC 19089 / CIP 103742 / CB 15) TaxID=190650 RepID=Q9AA22_CAUVC|nr:hypothetical protein CC_0786 [Caulobacter vibrioides CB15]